MKLKNSKNLFILSEIIGNRYCLDDKKVYQWLNNKYDGDFRTMIQILKNPNGLNAVTNAILNNKELNYNPF